MSTAVETTPLPKGGNGRNAKGQFEKGCSGGPGNPLGSKIEKLRQALVKAVDEKDIREIAYKLIEDAKKGDVPSTRELFDRIFGKAKEAIELTGKGGGPVETQEVPFDHDEFRNRFAAYLAGRIPVGSDAASPADRN